MALKGCFGSLKWTVFAFNLLFSVAGLAVLGLALWLRFDTNMNQSGTTNAVAFATGTYALMGAGVLSGLIGFLGFCGALRESQSLLGSFFAFLLIFLVIEVAVGAWSFKNRGDLFRLMRDEMKKTVREYGQTANNSLSSRLNFVGASFDTIHETLDCCGADGYADWAQSTYNGANGSIELGISSAAVVYRLPESCCFEPGTEQCKNYRQINRDNPPGETARKHIRVKGCAIEMEAAVRKTVPFLYGAIIGVAVIQILGMIFSMILCCAIRKIEDYKA